MSRVGKFILIRLSRMFSIHDLKQGTGSYLNGLSLNLICPPGVVSKARNNTDDITMSRVRVNLTWGTICQ